MKGLCPMEAGGGGEGVLEKGSLQKGVDNMEKKR